MVGQIKVMSLLEPLGLMLTVENVGYPSFQATCAAVNLADRLGIFIRMTIHDKEIIVKPGDDPHSVYRSCFNEPTEA